MNTLIQLRDELSQKYETTKAFFLKSILTIKTTINHMKMHVDDSSANTYCTNCLGGFYAPVF